MNKKDIPLKVLETIQNYINSESNSYLFIDPENKLLRCIDRDNNSDFHFVVEEVFNRHNLDLIVEMKPFSSDYAGVSRRVVHLNDLNDHFIKWVNLLRSYDEFQYFNDDVILNAYIAEYRTDLGIDGQNVDQQPLRIKQLYALDTHLKHIEASIQNIEEDHSYKDFDKITCECVLLRKSLTSNTRIKSLLKMAQIWGELTKVDLDILEICLPINEKEKLIECLKIN